MPYLNSRLCALLAMGLSLVAVPGLRAQDVSSAVAPAAIRGDVNGDGRVTREDADAVRSWLVRGTLPDGRGIMPGGDANGDGRVTAADAALISRFAAGVDVSRFPVGQPVGAGGERVAGRGMVSAEYECSMDFRSGNLACEVVSLTQENGARLNLMLYPSAAKIVSKPGGAYSGGNKSNPDTITYNYALLNLIPQPIGTTDGVTPDTSRLVVTGMSLISAPSGTAIQLDNPDGTATFVDSLNGGSPITYTNVPYMNYPELLVQNDTSSARFVRFVFHSSATGMRFSYRIWTRVQFPHGYITITPPTVPILEPAQTAQLTATVYNQFGVLQGDPINWTTSDPTVATVSSSGLVTAVGDGTATITATSTVDARRTASRVVTVDAAPTVVSTTPANNTVDVAANSDIIINFSESVNVTGSSFSLECPAASSKAFTVSGSGSTAITLNPDADLPVGETCTVKVVAAQVSDVDAVDGPNTLAADYTFSFEVAVTANADVLADTVIGNVPVNTANTSVPFSVTANDQLSPSATITFAGWSGAAGKTQQGGDIVVTPSGEGRGQFTYDPPAGFEGTDSFEYTIKSGAATSTATVTLTVDKMIWFVRAGAAEECTTHCGRMSSPFKALATFNTANGAGGSTNPENGEVVFVHEGTYAGPITLRAGQTLIGQDANATLAALADVKFPSMTGIPSTNGGDAGKVTISGADGINLAQNNAVYGLSLETTAGEAIGGSNFGTLTLANGTSHAADVAIASTGQALGLNTGTVSGVLASMGSTGGTNNVNLTSVSTTGTFSLGGGALSGATGDGFVIVNGGGSFTYTGTISNAAARAVNVSGKSGGTTTFSGNINPGGPGGGIAVASNTGGTVTFSGTAKNISSGTAAGVSLTGNTGATIAFTNGGLAIASTTGVPFTATGGGTVEVSGAGNTVVASGAAANAVNLNGIALAAGGMTFASIASNGTTSGSAFSATGVTGGGFTTGSLTVAGTTGGTSRGISVATSSAPFTFTTASVNNTGAEGIYLNGNTGVVAVNGGTVGNTAGDALSVIGGNAAVTVAATLTKSSAGRITNVASRTGGAVTVSNTLSCTGTCTGILANANAGTIDFTAATKTLTTGASAAVTLTNNTGTINFTNGGLAINTTSGAGFSASTGGGTVTVEGANNAITTTTGTALTVTDVNIGASGLTFRSITAGNGASGPANGIRLNNTGTLGFVTVTGDGSTAGSGGTIQRAAGGDGAAEGNGVYLNGTRNVSLSFMNFNDHANNGLYGTGVRGLTLNRVRFTGNNGTSNSGTYNESAVHLANVGGAVKFSGSRFDGGAMNAVRVDNSSGTAPALDSLVFVNDTVATMQGSTADVRGSALLVTLMDGTADVRFRDNRVLAWWSTGIHALVQGTASGTVRINNNFVDNTNGALAGATGIVAAGCRLGFNISGNTIRHTNGAAISSDMSPGCVNTVQGTIDGNFIGVSGDTNSGTATGVAIGVGGRAGTTTVKITNNVLRQINGSANGAITAVAGDNVLYGGSGTLNATISGNNIQETGSTVNSAQHGILITHGTTSSGANDSHQGCYDIASNTIANLNTASPAASQNRIRVNQRFGTTSRFPGYTGGQFSTTDLGSYLLSRNTASNATNANTSTGGFLNTVPAGSACPQPTM